jgi:hypothetical protein
MWRWPLAAVAECCRLRRQDEASYSNSRSKNFGEERKRGFKMTGDFDANLRAVLAKFDEQRRAETVGWARAMLRDEQRLARFPIATVSLVARMAGDAAHPTFRESQRIAAAWVRFQRGKNQAKASRKKLELTKSTA